MAQKKNMKETTSSNRFKQELISLITKAAYRFSAWEIYSDFLEIAAISISNTCDWMHRSTKEQKYKEVISKYTKEELKLFPKMLGALTNALEFEMTDILGEIFMEMELGSKWSGQFFTPMSVCRATAGTIMSGVKEQVEQLGFVTVCEPACGGGALVIAFAEAMQKQEINYQKHLLVTAQDLDIKSVHMTYLQLSLLGIPALVCHGNTLSMETFSVWKTPFYVLGNWQYKKQKEVKQPKKKLEFETLKDGQLSMLNVGGLYYGN